MQLVGVLEFVDQDVTKTPLVMLANGRVVPQQLVAAQHQFAKIDHAFALALRFIQRVNLGFLAAVLVANRHVLGALAVFLAGGNEPLQLLGREAVVVNIELLAQPLDGRELVLRIQDLERRRQIGQLVVRPQEAVAQAVKGANPHAAYIDRQHRRQAGQHFLGRFVGEGHRQNAAGRHLTGLQQPGDARGQHAGLARTGTRQDQGMRGRQRDGGELLWIEVVQQRRWRQWGNGF